MRKFFKVFACKKNPLIQPSIKPSFRRPSAFLTIDSIRPESLLGHNQLARQMVRWFLAFLLLFAGITKIYDPAPTIEILSLVGLSKWQVKAVLIILPLFEIGVAVMMFLRRYARIGAWFALCLFSGFLGFSAYLVLSGIEAECGCFGKAIQSAGGWWLIIRNGIFLNMVLWLLARKEVAHEKAAIQ